MKRAPLVAIRVTLPQPVMGRQIVHAVETIVNRLGNEFRSTSDSAEPRTVGQSADDSERNLAVVADVAIPHLELHQTYTSVVVIDYPWPGVSFAIEDRPEFIRLYAQQLADSLQAYFQH